MAEFHPRGQIIPFQPRGEPTPLNPGGGGGTSDGMEARIAALEAHMSHVQGDLAQVKTDVRELRTDMAALKATVADLPRKGFIVLTTIGGMGLFAAVIAFADQIRKLLGVH